VSGSPRGISLPVIVILGDPIPSLVDAVIVQLPLVDGSIAPSVDTAGKSANWTSK
jgi:hypothetical protein